MSSTGGDLKRHCRQRGGEEAPVCMRPRTGSGDRPMRRSASRKFRLRTRSQVTNPLAVVSDGNGRATDHQSIRPTHRLGPSPAIISTVTYAHVVHVLAIYRIPRELRLSESRGKYVPFTEESRDAGERDAPYVRLLWDRNSAAAIRMRGFPSVFFDFCPLRDPIRLLLSSVNLRVFLRWRWFHGAWRSETEGGLCKSSQ